MASEPVIEHPSDTDVLGLFFTGVEQHQYELNRTAARRAASLADAIGFARAHPEIYALPGDPAPVATAERCAVIDAALRLQLPENQVRNLASTADRARALLPALWERAWEGFATLTQVEIGADLLSRFDEHDDTRAVFDTALAEAALTCSPGAFRAKARRLADRLAPAADPVLEHEAAFARRRLSIEPDQAGMSWVHLYTDTARARAIYRRATSTAKNMRKRARRGRLNDPRTRDQVRADLAAGWLTGAGSPTAVKTKVYVTVPADVLTETARASVRELPVPAGAPDLNEAARLDTGETIDRATAIRMLLEAGSFTRIITDPVTGVILDMDRRSRTATRHQREWLIQTHATCSRDGCTHAAAEADVDHWDPYNGPNRGPTDLSNLAPLCATENLDKQRTRFRYRRRPDGTVQLTTPTGGSTRPPRPGEREAVELLARLRSRTAPPLPDQPPF